MARKIFILIVAILLMVSCLGRKSDLKSVSASSITSFQQPKIVRSTITNPDGITLKQTFNNVNGTCVLVLKGELIELKQDRMASGIKYSNEHYIYTNWHGETRLLKDGKLIFSHDE